MVPALIILALGLPLFVKLAGPPAIKATSSSISLVVATSDPTSTREVAPKTMPFGLIITNLPLAEIFPSMRDDLVSVMRLTVTEFSDGCWKVTFSCCATSKLFQRIMARFELCWITVSAHAWVTKAAPPTMSDPSGAAKESCANAVTATIQAVVFKNLPNKRFLKFECIYKTIHNYFNTFCG